MKWIPVLAAMAAFPAAASAQQIFDGTSPFNEADFVGETDRYTVHIIGVSGAITVRWGVGDNPNSPNLVPYTPIAVADGIYTR